MDKLQQVFTYSGNQVRTIVILGEPWIVAQDVCSILGLGNISQAVSRLDDDEKGIYLNDTPGGPQEMLHVNEAGLYTLVLASKKPEAKTFKRWLTHEVLPSIRRTGGYGKVAVETPTQALLQTVQLLASQEQKLLQLEASQKVIQSRLDTIDNVNIQGDKRQKLNMMVRKYAHKHGYTFSKAWKDFVSSFNTSYRANLTARIQNHSKANITIPGYLEEAGLLDDALRVADKMLQAKGA